jgi:hypothetical protein
MSLANQIYTQISLLVDELPEGIDPFYLPFEDKHVDAIERTINKVIASHLNLAAIIMCLQVMEGESLLNENFGMTKTTRSEIEKLTEILRASQDNQSNQE